MKASFALGSLILVACDVEPPNLPPIDASFPDAQPFADSGPKDASEDAGPIECSDDGECGDREYCSEGFCAARPIRCASHAACRAGDRCARPLVGTGTQPGFCKDQTRLTAICDGDGDCADGEVCTAHGYCVQAAVAVTIDLDDRLALISSCSEETDCGPAGLCDEAAGACTSCATNGDCPRQLLCQDGACVERQTCSTDQHCFPANQCMSQRCVRRSDCRTDGGDMIANAIQLEPALYQELGLCSDRAEGWFAFDISGREGARIALTSTRSEVTIAMELLDDAGREVEARWLSLPGSSIAEVSAPGFAMDGTSITRKILIRVTSRDHAGRYDLDLSRPVPLCPGDALDQYGDRDRSRALPIAGNSSYVATACPGDEDWVRLSVDRDDQILLDAAFGGSGTDLDLAAYAGSATVAIATSVNTSSEALDTGRIAEPATMFLRAFPKQAPSAGQDYRLDVTRFPGTFFRACRDAIDLPLAGGAISLSGDLTSAEDLGAPRCSLYAEEQRNDLLYRIAPPSAPSVLRAQITPRDSTSEITAAIVSACASAEATTLFCDSAELPRRALTIETLLDDTDPIFLLVSSDGSSEDMVFDLDLMIEPVAIPANNACAGAAEILASGTIDAATYGATNDVEATGPACGLSDDDGQGPDIFYLLRLDGGERAALELDGPRGGLLWAATDCGQMTSTCTVAEAISYEDPVAQVALTPAIDSTFFIAVDGLDMDDLGTFDLRAVLAPECLDARDCTGSLRCDDYRCVPVPPNDTCTGAEVIALDAQGRATVIASTGAANANISLTCLGQSDRDVVYRIDLPVDASSLTARIVEARFDPALAIRRAPCEASLEEVCNDDVRFLGLEEPNNILLPEVTWVQPAAGTYFVIVDAYAGSGTFTLQIEALQ